ncbi:MDR family MFS transporter [Amycolatopsis sp. WQ 127309]|uniref:MDR family MFS transporter n=1 Tax=Amycolatopsis sp. WQ 127309 TaxID=2932773 RepID=UPI001FF263B6|nr:MDR family MFS transporter [Amycolatopsis sp. WQ 127309]UOZ03620.1 DHA2 family efflux MFS transporter permease subunit [Amycolatopsis sp. WQ 127309]
MTADTPARDGVDPKVLKTALILVVGALAVVFDTTIVSVALHQLATSLDVPVSTIQWVTTGYMLALGAAVPLSTWALTRFGGKRVWMFALTVFLAGSIGSSLAWDAGSLIGWRVLQGLGGGLMLPVMTTLIMQAAGGHALGRTMTWVALPGLLGPILGPLAGGAIITDYSWRFMFWVNVPFCVAGLILAGRYLPEDPPAAARARLDVWGLVLLVPGIVAVLLGLSNAGAAGFGRFDVLAPLAIGVVFLVAFTLYALRHRDPLVDIRLLAARSVGSSTAVLFLSGFSLFGAMLLLPLYYQEVRGVTALTAGLMLVPQGIGALLSRQIAGPLTDRIGAQSIAVAGFVVVAAATVPFAFVDATSDGWLLALWLLIRGVGLGAVTMPVMTASYVGLARAEIGHASVLTRIAQQVGGSFGTAVLAVVLEQAIAGAGPGAAVTGFHVAFWWATGFSLLATALCVWLPGRKQVQAANDAAAAATLAAAQPVKSGKSSV